MAGNIQIHGSNSKRNRCFKQNSAINITPLVDVMLVLLVIFMMATPTTTVGIKVNLPQTSAQRLNGEKDTIIISINENREIFIQDSPIEFDKIIEKLSAIIGNNKNAVVYVRGDKKLAYENIIKIMGLIADSGIAKVSLIVEQSQKPSSSSSSSSSPSTELKDSKTNANFM
ncbi:MAG: biopolymer transporter ExbD [Holosporales bacterium]|jgi:biopolymer transport protein TolR|nr:biopolymer transporter ExbD [Holosporales bacterium]